MNIDLANLTVEKVMVHIVHKRDDDRKIVKPDYSNALTPLDPKGTMTLQKRMISALGSDSHGVELEIVKDDENSFLQLAGTLLNLNDNEFILQSQRAADKLAEAQTSRQYPGGAVIVIRGTIGVHSKRFICSIKAETQDGFHNKQELGKIVMEHVSDLLLTPQQKLYKIGLFIEREKLLSSGKRKAEEFSAYVFDHNMTQRETSSAAQYFYEGYLGCAVPQSAKKQTRDFYNATKAFINAAELTSEDKVDLYNSLYTYLKMDTSKVIGVNDFSKKYLSDEMRTNYSKHMESKGFTMQSIPKDIEYLSTALKRRRLRFSSSVQLIAPAEEFNKLVTVVSEDSNATTLRILGTVSKQE